MLKRKHLSQGNWQQIRALWEAGAATFNALSVKFETSISSIKSRSHRENWQRGALASVIQEKIKESMVDMLARLGMPKEELVKLVIEGARKTECLKDVSRAYRSDDGKTVMQGSKPVVVRHTVTVIDNEHTYKYRQLLAQLAGWYAPPKSPIAPDSDGEVREIPVAEEIKTIALPNEQKHN